MTSGQYKGIPVDQTAKIDSDTEDESSDKYETSFQTAGKKQIVQIKKEVCRKQVSGKPDCNEPGTSTGIMHPLQFSSSFLQVPVLKIPSEVECPNEVEYDSYSSVDETEVLSSVDEDERSPKDPLTS